MFERHGSVIVPGQNCDGWDESGVLLTSLWASSPIGMKTEMQ